MGQLARRHALGLSGAAVWALKGPQMKSAAAATAPDVPANLLAGKKCLLIGTDDVVSTAVKAGLAAAAAGVTVLEPLGTSEAPWSDTFLAETSGLAKTDVILNLCIPDRTRAFGVIDTAEFRRVIEASYTRTFLALKYGTQLLKASGGGAFINVTSNAGTTGMANAVGRCAAAHGIVMMTKCAALTCAADGVRVNALLAAEVVANGNAQLSPGTVSPEDVASAVVFLASEASSYYTGLIMPVDNGGTST